MLVKLTNLLQLQETFSDCKRSSIFAFFLLALYEDQLLTSYQPASQIREDDDIQDEFEDNIFDAFLNVPKKSPVVRALCTTLPKQDLHLYMVLRTSSQKVKPSKSSYE